MDRDERITMLLCDGDAFALENTYRMDIPNFGNKAAVLAEELLERFDCAGLNFRWIGEYVAAGNVERIIQNGDCVLLACDNHATRHLVNRRCCGGELTDVVLISGGNDGVEEGRGTYGNVQVYVRAGGRDIRPVEPLSPEIATPADRSPGEKSCIEAAAAGGATRLHQYGRRFGHVQRAARLLMPRDREPLYDEVSLDVFDATCLPHWFSPTPSA